MRWLAYHVGRRGCALLFFAFIDLVSAFSYLRPTAEARHAAIVVYVAQIAPLYVWAGLWGAVGVICLVSAFLRHDRIGFGAAMVVKMLWAIITLNGWLLANVERGYVGAAVWFALAGWVAIIAGWNENTVVDDRRARRARQ